MSTYVALLRGINVAGHNKLAMKDLVAAFEALGFADVKTYVQSGNVVCTGKKAPPEKVKGVLVLTRKAAELAKLIAANPFAKEKGVDPKTLHVTFLAKAPAKAGLAKLAAIKAGDDRYHVAGKELYLHCPNGYGRSKLANTALERALGVEATTRNWKTVNALHALASEAE